MYLRTKEGVSSYCFHLTGFSDCVHYTPCELEPSSFMYLRQRTLPGLSN